MRISLAKFVILIIMSVFGLWSSGMVLFLYYTLHTPLPFCQLGSLTSGLAVNCYAVLSSSYDSLFGVPLDVFAAAYFIVNLALIYVVSFGGSRWYKRAFRTLFAWRFLGILLVPYLVYLEIVVLKAICVYCTVMHVAIIVDFVVITYFLFYGKNFRNFLSKGAR